ncbi:type 1 glutamine amidotransferase [Oryzifoliimicrobium ureilyticus]|uniref:type 1 glutamine amidotransferase n=1 Tax=Oryzifoliimicrobium ureilyticus TaxID=3113724 RepID=UPI003075F513
MRVAIIENMINTQLGALGEALNEAGALLNWYRPWKDGVLPRFDSAYSALLVMGGEQSAVDDDVHPYLPELVRLLRQYGEAGRPVLGICLGSQILARAYGAENKLGATLEFGWHEIELTDEGKDDPVLSAVAGSFTIFQWHSDTFSLPEGAIRLAKNGAVANQAFRVGSLAYGTQFHFEANSDVIEVWKGESAPTIERLAPGWLADYDRIAAENAPNAEAAGLALARAWVRLVKQHEQATQMPIRMREAGG